jgi:photosystem II stability/assembly factor-like uncharacterized protein
MDEVEPAGLSPRGRRGIALIALALMGMAAGVAVYLWSTMPHPYSGPPPPATSQPIPVSMDWHSGAEGWIVVHDAGGPESILFRTTDGGGRWQREFEINGPAFVRFTDSSHGTIRANAAQAAGARVLRTDDAGAHWRPVLLPQLLPGATASQYFLDRDRGWLIATESAGGATRTRLFATEDGGQTWHSLSEIQGGVAGDLLFVSATTGWLFGRGGDGVSVLFMTRDGGRSWIRQDLPVGSIGPVSSDLLDIAAPSVSADGTGVLPVYDRQGMQVWMYATRDGGVTWGEPRPLPWRGNARRPAFLDGRTGWTWDGTSAWLSGDGGRSWNQVGGLPGGWQFSEVVPVGAATAWAVAAQDTGRGSLGPTRWALFRTTDAGQHWTRVPMPSLE